MDDVGKKEPVNGASPPEEPPTLAALKVALRAHIETIVQKPFGHRMLLELQTATQQARNLLMALESPRQRHQPGMYGQAQLAGMGEYIGAPGYDMPVPDDYPGQPVRAETFGATIIRELIAAVKTWNTRKPTVNDLVLSIGMAKTQELGPEVIASLEKELAALLAESTIGPETQAGFGELPAPPAALVANTEEASP